MVKPLPLLLLLAAGTPPAAAADGAAGTTTWTHRCFSGGDPAAGAAHAALRDMLYSGGARGPMDIRRALFPAPASVRLLTSGGAVYDPGPATAINALQFDRAENLVIEVTQAGEGTAAAREQLGWSLRRFCRRLGSAAARPAGAAPPPQTLQTAVVRHVRVSCTGPGDAGPPQQGMDEGYRLTVGAAGADLSASTRHGINRGLETLLMAATALPAAGSPSPPVPLGSWLPGRVAVAVGETAILLNLLHPPLPSV